MGLCTVISVATAIMMLWLIPELFKLAKALEAERCERLLLESFQATLNNAVQVGLLATPVAGCVAFVSECVDSHYSMQKQ